MSRTTTPPINNKAALSAFLESEEGYQHGMEMGIRDARNGHTIPTFNISIRKDRWAQGYRQAMEQIQRPEKRHASG